MASFLCLFDICQVFKI